jgi:transcriptional regulator with XRE-family HTH domain
LRGFYLAEWLEHLTLPDQVVADRMGIARETIWRWRVGARQPRDETRRLLANAMGIEPEQLSHPPKRPSLDALVKDMPDEEHAKIYGAVRHLIGKPS